MVADNMDSLLCDEESESLCFDDSDGGAGKATAFFDVRSDSQSSPLAVAAPFLSDESIGWMIERERFHLVRDDYLRRLRSGELDMSLRRQALDWMFKARAHHGFGELCLHLAVNYLDRFLSVYHLPVGKTWAIQLAAVACLSLAAKVDEVHIPSTIDLQAGEPKYLFEGKTVQRMEILVLSSLSWNVKPYTPFNFIDYFLGKLNNNVEIPPSALISRSIQVILSTIKGIDFLEFKPSEIAAAVATYVSAEKQKQPLDIDKTLSGFIVVEKGRVMKCVEMIQDLIITISESPCSSSTNSTVTMTTIAGNNGSSSSFSSTSIIPKSQNGVLDVAIEACMSCMSDHETLTVRSCPCSSSSDINKRRRLD